VNLERCLQMTGLGDTPEARQLCADPYVQRCLSFHAGDEPTVEALVACYGPTLREQLNENERRRT
jgi:hypothetical protein